MPYYELPEVGEILPMRMMHHVKVFSGWLYRQFSHSDERRCSGAESGGGGARICDIPAGQR